MSHLSLGYTLEEHSRKDDSGLSRFHSHNLEILYPADLLNQLFEAQVHLFIKKYLSMVARTNYKVIVEKRSEEHTSELQSRGHLVCRLLLEKKKTNKKCTCV